MKRSGILPSGLCCIVVVDGAVDHGFEWFVVLAMDHEFVELGFEKSGCGVYEWFGM